MSIRTIIKNVLPPPARKRWYRKEALAYLRSLDVTIDPNKPTAVVLNHFFDQDCRALQLAAEKCNLVVLDAPRLMRGSHLYFSTPVIELTVPYVQESSAHRCEWRQECELMWAEIARKWQPRWLIASNDNFYWIREFIPVAQRNKCTAVILDKEGTISPHSWDYEVERAKKFVPCISDLVCAWSERQAEFWRRIGVPNDRVRVVGQPRSDLWFQPTSHEVDSYFQRSQPLVTLFSYDDTAYIPIERVAQDGLTWRHMKQETHDGIARLAGLYPNINFVIKTHPQQTDREELAKKYNGENLKVICGSSIANELIQTSIVCIAFQTTAVIEGMALGRPMIYTNWDPLIEELKGDILPLAGAPGIVTAASLKQTMDTVKRVIDRDLSDFAYLEAENHARRAFVDGYFFQPDGKSSNRFFEAIFSYVAIESAQQ